MSTWGWETPSFFFQYQPSAIVVTRAFHHFLSNTKFSLVKLDKSPVTDLRLFHRTLLSISTHFCLCMLQNTWTFPRKITHFSKIFLPTKRLIEEYSEIKPNFCPASIFADFYEKIITKRRKIKCTRKLIVRGILRWDFFSRIPSLEAAKYWKNNVSRKTCCWTWSNPCTSAMANGAEHYGSWGGSATGCVYSYAYSHRLYGSGKVYTAISLNAPRTWSFCAAPSTLAEREAGLRANELLFSGTLSQVAIYIQVRIHVRALYIRARLRRRRSRCRKPSNDSELAVFKPRTEKTHIYGYRLDFMDRNLWLVAQRYKNLLAFHDSSYDGYARSFNSLRIMKILIKIEFQFSQRTGE